MKPKLELLGNAKSPLVIIDEFSGEAEEIAQLADALAPFPVVAGIAYPGVRRTIRQTDEDAYSYVMETCQRLAPFIGGAFEVSGFDLDDASFSIVSTPPELLAPVQRAPHFDSADQRYLAILHYLRVPQPSGTAFYRHRSTGIERVSNDNLDRLKDRANIELENVPPDPGYMNGSTKFFEQIGRVDAAPDRLIIYQGSLLHSGIIPVGMRLTSDPKHGRLTSNLFVRAY